MRIPRCLPLPSIATRRSARNKFVEIQGLIDALDRALVDFGFPVGPITLLDEVGIDVGGKVGVVLAEAFGARMAPSEGLRRVVQAGRLTA